jgi:hypothetical protein
MFGKIKLAKKLAIFSDYIGIGIILEKVGMFQ